VSGGLSVISSRYMLRTQSNVTIITAHLGCFEVEAD